ncbi:MAG: Fe-S-containing protein [Terriglobales bacterium]|jgi:FTR1 family protein
MFQSLVITLREGVEAALIVGIVLGYLKKTGRQTWSRYVWWGLVAAIAASLAAAYLVHRFEVVEDAYEGWLMLLGATFVATMVYWMWRTGKRLKLEIESKLAELSASPSRGAASGLFLFVFLMVFREGAETVLFLAAVSLRTTELLNFMGGVLGLALAVALGVAFFKGSVKVDLRKFFTVTTMVLFVVAAQLLVSGVHELSEAQVLPSGPREMALIGPIVNNDAFFFVVIVALALFLVVVQRIQAGNATAADAARLSPPERRKLLADQQRDRFWKLAATAASLLVIVLISAQFIYSRTAQAMTLPERVSIENGEAQIPTGLLADHDLHRYAIDVGGTEVRVIAVLDSSGTVRAGLDACVICGHQGYYQDGKNVICRNCGAVIYVPTIGLAGGCNPIHIDYVIEGDKLHIAATALADAAKHFH